METPRFTVYIASHNYGAFLEDAIESVLRQSADGWELLVIDDNSDDDTSEVMSLYEGDARIRTFRTTGVGLPAVCNLAVAEARGRYIIRLDGDDVFDENILLVLGNYLDRNPEIALVFPDYYLMDEQGEVFGHERRGKVYDENHVLDAPANGACTMVRTDIIRKLGGYREDLGAQDGFDLWTKLVDRHKIANVNLPLFYYRRHGRNLTENTQRILHARQQIKRDATLSQVTQFRPYIAVIPCRRNYDFQQDLWRQRINGMSLLAHDIQVCLSSSVLDHVVVACDNPEAEEVVRAFDDPRLQFFLRDPKDTIRSQSIAVTLEKCVRPLDPSGAGTTVLSYIQTPFVTRETLEEAIYTLVMNQADSACGVEEISDPLYRRAAHGLYCLNPARRLSSDFDSVYREASTALAARNRNFATGSLMGSRIVHYTVSSDECFFINSPRTLDIARIIEEEKK